MVQRTVTNGSVDYYKWFGGLTGKVLEGENGWDKALMQTSEGLSTIGGVG
jgi:hypothetical protein